ncbi:MAG TPA: SAM-dependent methyltransferase, partial [Thermodesulfobacteriota bacterium]|nr:SAM-dependent methyltransferase [Thermodesulfobacteriota bacterium]
MSAIKLKSENPKMSWVISKNPESGMVSKGLRLGVAFGWFTPNQEDEYNVYFKDADDEVSFKTFRDEQFEYLNMSRFNSALFIVNSIDEFFRSSYKTMEESDVSGEYENSFFINMIEIKNERYLTSFKKFFNDFDIEYENTISNNYRVTVKTKKSIHELLNFIALFAIFNA